MRVWRPGRYRTCTGGVVTVEGFEKVFGAVELCEAFAVFGWYSRTIWYVLVVSRSSHGGDVARRRPSRMPLSFASQVSKKKASNPAVQQRKAEKARQMARNKQERQMQREAMQHVDDPAYLRQQLKELLDEEEASGMLNAALRSKKKTLQMAYEAAIKKQIQTEAQKKRREEASASARGDGSAAVPVLDVSAIPLPSMPPPPGMNATSSGRGPDLPPPSRPPPGPPVEQAYVMKLASGAGAGVVSGASTVVARPKAQHDVALTSMVPSSVVRRPMAGGSKVGVRPQAAVKVADDVPDSLEDFLKSL